MEAGSIVVHFFDDGLSETNRMKLVQTVRDYGREIVFYDIRKELDKLENVAATLNVYSPQGGVKSSYTAYGRILIGELLPDNVKRALYLDCDTFIDDDLRPLFEMPMNNPVSVVLDGSRPEYKQCIGLGRNDFYFNSGVMLFDLEQWRKGNWTRKVLEYIRSDGNVYPFADQDYLNHALKGNFGILGCRYNFAPQFFLYSYFGFKFVYGFDEENKFYEREEFEAAQRHAAIYHCYGTALTRFFYSNSKSPIKAKYDRVYFESYWKDVPQRKYDVSRNDLVRNFLFLYTPKWFSALISQIAMKRAMKGWLRRVKN